MIQDAVLECLLPKAGTSKETKKQSHIHGGVLAHCLIKGKGDILPWKQCEFIHAGNVVDLKMQTGYSIVNGSKIDPEYQG